MGQALLVEPSLSDTGTFAATGSSAATEAPKTFMQTMQPKEVCEFPSAAAGSKTFTIGLGTGFASGFDCFALLLTNLSASATWKIESDTTAAMISPTTVLDTATFRATGQTGYPRTHGLYVHSSNVTEEFIRFTLSDTGNSDGVLRLGRLYIGKAWRFYADFGARIGFLDAAETIETVAGERITHQREAIPFASFQITSTGASAWADVQTNLHEIYRKRGSSRDVLFCLDPDDSSYAGRLIRYGTLQPDLSFAVPGTQHYVSQLEIMGLI